MQIYCSACLLNVLGLLFDTVASRHRPFHVVVCIEFASLFLLPLPSTVKIQEAGYRFQPLIGMKSNLMRRLGTSDFRGI